ncbi:MAG: DUF1444 family protein [Chloroflexales bacterium]|nr:DUF1444 family protein [Chloroflexales bacterium]
MTTAAPNGNGHILDREGFTAYVEQQLQSIAHVEVLQSSEMELILRVRGSDMRVGLENFYASYLKSPVHLDSVVATLLKTLQGFKPERSTQSFEELRDRIFPMLKPIDLLVDVHERQLPMLIYRPFLANLIIAYVIDEIDSVTYLNEEHLEHWRLTEHALHDQALENLRKRTLEQTSYTTAGDGAQQLFIYSTQDGYDATRLLLTDVLEEWRKQLPGKIVIGIPNRDFLIALSDSDRTILTNVAQQIQVDATQRAYGLTDQLFTLVGDEVRSYEWE